MAGGATTRKLQRRVRLRSRGFPTNPTSIRNHTLVIRDAPPLCLPNVWIPQKSTQSAKGVTWCHRCGCLSLFQSMITGSLRATFVVRRFRDGAKSEQVFTRLRYSITWEVAMASRSGGNTKKRYALRYFVGIKNVSSKWTLHYTIQSYFGSEQPSPPIHKQNICKHGKQEETPQRVSLDPNI